MKVTTITISAKDAAAIHGEHQFAVQGSVELTDLIREESKLKQHHRAYLHVRDNIDGRSRRHGNHVQGVRGYAPDRL